MAYVGSIGAVNVLEFLSAELFDESQENPYLLSQANISKNTSSNGSDPVVMARSSFRPPSITTELPLQDESSPLKHNTFGGDPLPVCFFQSPEVSVPSLTARMSVRGSISPQTTPKSILKRKCSVDSNASTVFSSADCESPTAAANSDSEVHKLLYSLKRFGLASTYPPASDANGTCASPAASAGNSSLPLDLSGEQNGSLIHSSTPPTTYSPFASAAPAPTRVSFVGFDDSKCGNKKKRKARCGKFSRKSNGKKARKVHRKGKLSTSSSFEDSNSQTVSSASTNSSTKRASISYAAFQQCLRGGGGVSRLSKRDNTKVSRKKSLGTISSHLKRRQKFIRPTILTDAFNRVSDMRLGTNPLRASIKHLAFPDTGVSQAEEFTSPFEEDSPRRRQQLGRNSLIDVETLDRIGSRAACPVQLLEEKAPDYSQVEARVDSYNRSPRAERTYRRPSAWVLKAATDSDASDFQDS